MPMPDMPTSEYTFSAPHYIGKSSGIVTFNSASDPSFRRGDALAFSSPTAEPLGKPITPIPLSDGTVQIT